LRRIVLTLTLTAAALLLVAPAAFAQANDQNCKDFDSQAEAQAHLDANKSDPDRLDGDNDGQACDNFNYEEGRVVLPDGDPNRQLPNTGAIVGPQAGLAAGLLTVGGLVLWRTRYRARH
jgi:LPXTG-motif cell wall-anchored protein